MSWQKAKYQIKSRHMPAKHQLLSSTVVVRGESGEVGYCYIGFSDDLVQDVGMALTSGVTPCDPAYIEVVFNPGTRKWLIKARYVSGAEEKLLWATDNRPEWLKIHGAKVHNGSPSQTQTRNRRRERARPHTPASATYPCAQGARLQA